MLDSEKEIIKRAVRGEASAFGELYEHYQPKIYRFVLLKVSRREEAEDLTHQIFLNAWQRVEKYEDLGFPFSSWLYQIARNQVIDHYRTTKTHVDIEEVVDHLVARENHEHEAEDHLALERIAQGIQKLKPIQQDVIIMRFIEELSVKETAEALSKTEGAVKLLQHRAMKELREILGEPKEK